MSSGGDSHPLLSRLMRKGAGPGRTRDDHLDLASQMVASLARSRQVGELAELVGATALGDADRVYVGLTDTFERVLLNQSRAERRDLATTLELAWSVAATLPPQELTMLPAAMVAAHGTSPAPWSASPADG